MFFATWAFVLLVSGAPVKAGEVKEPTLFETQMACEAHVASHRARMEDWVRGAARVHWSVDVAVSAVCAAEGKDA